MKMYPHVMKKYKFFAFMIVFLAAVSMLWSNADAFRRRPKRAPVDLVEKGRDIFFNETFDGNGRTCGTCHPAENNLTIDPAFIATLPQDDPLFVAENIPELANLENPELMRKFGLILENLNGFDQEGFFRCVPHMLSLNLTVGPPSANVMNGKFLEATGWSGDGSPLAFPGTGVTPEFLEENGIKLDGSLKMFMQGAIVQHYPKTLARVPGQDFRLATEEELVALEAFLRSLGRKEELDLDSMEFRSAFVNEGKRLFTGEAKCSLCHVNAGARNFADINANINTGVEDVLARPAHIVDPDLMDDDGFGGNGNSSGDGSFNIPPLVEAADTPPFFHNNSASTIEAAVSFFESQAFQDSQGGAAVQGISLDSSQKTAIAVFLRAINALENIRLANELDRNIQQARFFKGRSMLKASIADTKDAIEVLTGGEYVLFDDAVKLLKEALRVEKKARTVGIGKRNKLLARAIDLREAAREAILK